MDMRGDHRRPKVVEEPRRTPWLAIILAVLAAVAGWSVISQLGLEPRPREVLPDRDAPVIVVEEDQPPVATGEGQGAQGARLAPGAPAPRWVTRPMADFPAGTEVPGKAKVTLDCGIEADLTLGDCRVIEETPPGHGFGRSAIDGAERARVSGRGAEGRRVVFSMHFVLPD